MKKFFFACLILLISCTASYAKINVVVSYPYIADITQRIGKEYITVSVFAKGDCDPHFVVPRPSFIAKAANADLLIINGAQLEIGWIPPIINQANNSRIMPGRKGFLDLSQYVKLCETPAQVSREHGDVHPDGNPHFILDPQNVPLAANAIAARLSELDPAHAAYYKMNAAAFYEQWTLKENEWSKAMQPLKGVHIFEYHRLYVYFANRYGLIIAGDLEPLPGIPPTSKHLQQLLAVQKREHVQYILQDVYHGKHEAQYIAKKSGIKLVIIPHDVTAVEESSDVYFLNCMMSNCTENEQMISILLPAFLLSLILLGIHSYFGLEIIKRGIIFTDLAVGQMAACGAGVSLLFFNGTYIYLISLAFALCAGLVIAYAAKHVAHLEAFIGLLYAAGFSGVFILLSKSPHGMERFQQLMASDILFTPLNEMLKVAVVYGLLGLFIFIFNRRTQGFLRDVLFFVTFSVTVTSSVRLAGVLVVFALLVAPSFIALRIKGGIPIFKAWVIGTIVNLLAILVSYNFDLPTGYTLVFMHAVTAATCALKRMPVY